MEVLKQIIKEKLYCFHDSCDSWEDSIVKNAEPLVKNGYVDGRYTEAVINCIKEHGPYIILIPNVAMPHSTENAEGIFKTGVAFMKVNKPVRFDEEKSAQLFFMVASENGEQHMKNIQNLCEIFENQNLLNDLAKVDNEMELAELVEQYCK